MKILKPYVDDHKKFSSLTEDYMKNAIFLAGPCPRKDYEKKRCLEKRSIFNF